MLTDAELEVAREINRAWQAVLPGEDAAYRRYAELTGVEVRDERPNTQPRSGLDAVLAARGLGDEEEFYAAYAEQTGLRRR